MAQSKFEYDDTTPEGWDPGVYRRQEGLGGGISLRHGRRPPEADEVAARGTPEWRRAWNVMQDWIGKQLYTGATLGDMGFTREHEHGKQHFLRLSRGEYGGFRRGWAEQAGSHGRAYIDPYTGEYRMSSFGTGGGAPGTTQGVNGTSIRPPGPPGMSNASVPTPAMGAQGTTQPTYIPAAAAAGGPVSSQDSYMQNPRGRRPKMTLRSLAGAAPTLRPGSGPGGVHSNATLIRRQING